MWKEIKILNFKELLEIKDRAGKATAGPWAVHRPLNSFGGTSETRLIGPKDIDSIDWDFIAHSREDIPRLIECLEKALEVVRFYAEEKRTELGHIGSGIVTMGSVHDPEKAREFLKSFEGDGE